MHPVFVCGLLSGIGMLIFEKPDLSTILQAWMPILYAGVMSCGVAYTLQIVGQKLAARELVGCVVMFAAIILAQLPERPSPSANPAGHRNASAEE